jgi:hypothetical protein
VPRCTASARTRRQSAGSTLRTTIWGGCSAIGSGSLREGFEGARAVRAAAAAAAYQRRDALLFLDPLLLTIQRAGIAALGVALQGDAGERQLTFGGLP